MAKRGRKKATGSNGAEKPYDVVGLRKAIGALYGRKLAGPWRAIYVASAIFALYLNVFVAVAQSFDKVTYLHKFAPTGSEPPFAVVQALVLIVFVVIGFLALRRYHPALRA